MQTIDIILLLFYVSASFQKHKYLASFASLGTCPHMHITRYTNTWRKHTLFRCVSKALHLRIAIIAGFEISPESCNLLPLDTVSLCVYKDKLRQSS